ncbi:MAG: hypothetical protein LBS68_02760, partial [Puniceicoccales bacterium]|nr:hypothetical protein [Puniceicoccales bacterium]
MPSDVPKSMPSEKKASAASLKAQRVSAVAILTIVGSLCALALGAVGAFALGVIGVFVHIVIVSSVVLAVIFAVAITVSAYNKHRLSFPPPTTYLDEHSVLVTVYCLDAFLDEFDGETRNQVTSVTCVTSDEGKMQLSVEMNGQLFHVDVDDLESADTAFPKMKVFNIKAQLTENVTFDDCSRAKFKELQVILFKNARTPETFSLTMVGEFGALEVIDFSGCNDMRNLNFSGEELTGIEDIGIFGCQQLTNVAGIWDGEHPLFDRESFRELTIKSCENFPSEGIGNWLAVNAKKYEERLSGRVYISGRGAREISVTLIRLKDLPTLTSFSELTDLSFVDYSPYNATEKFHIPHRNLIGSSRSINASSYHDNVHHLTLTAVELFFDGAAVEPPPQNATGTNAINTSRVNGDNYKLHIAVKDPVEKVIFKNKPAEPLTVALTKKSPLLTVEFPSLEAVPEEMLLKVTNCAGGGA